MIPADKILCLAHEHDRAPRNPRVPPNFCDRLATRARHQAISRFPFDGIGHTYHVNPRVCQPGKHDAYIPLEGTDSDGEAA